VAVLALCAVWAPPLVDQLVHSPGNLGEVARFAAAPHPGPGLRAATRFVSADLARFPSWRGRFVGASTSVPSRPPLALLVYVLFGAATAAVGHRLGDRFLRAAGVLFVAAVGASIVAVSRITGPTFSFLIAWVSVLPVPLWIAWAATGLRQIAGRWPLGPAALAGALLAALVAVAGVTARPLADGSVTVPTNDEVAAAWRSLRTALPGHHDAVLIRIGELGRWPMAAGLALQLRKAGHPVGVPAEWRYMFGPRLGPPAGTPFEVLLDAPSTQPDTADGRRFLGR